MTDGKAPRRRIYADNAATTPVLPEVIDRMAVMMREAYGNPSSRHAMGLEADRALAAARETVAEAIGATPKEIVFTSGGTEGNNLALKGAAHARSRRGKRIVSQPTEHPSVLEPLKALQEEGFEVKWAGVDAQGAVDLSSFVEMLTPDTVLVSAMWVNNELGTVQPIEEIARAVRERVPEALLHVDAVQALGKVPIDARVKWIDLLTVSSHKVHGPKGVGALFVRDGVRISASVEGGGQEAGLRSGTENVPGVVGFGEAVGRLLPHLHESISRMRRCKQLLWERLRSTVTDVQLNGPSALEDGAPHILSLSFPGLRGDVLLGHLEAAGVFVSTGSACSSRRTVASHVLDAAGLTPRRAEGTIRVSLSPLTTDEEAVEVADVLADSVGELRALMN